MKQCFDCTVACENSQEIWTVLISVCVAIINSSSWEIFGSRCSFWQEVLLDLLSMRCFYLMFPSCQSHFNRRWSISVCALMSSSTGALSSAHRSDRCCRTGRGLTKISSDIFWSLVVFFPFLFPVGLFQKNFLFA